MGCGVPDFDPFSKMLQKSSGHHGYLEGFSVSPANVAGLLGRLTNSTESVCLQRIYSYYWLSDRSAVLLDYSKREGSVRQNLLCFDHDEKTVSCNIIRHVSQDTHLQSSRKSCIDVETGNSDHPRGGSSYNALVHFFLGAPFQKP